MDKIEELIEEIGNFAEIPYFAKRFQRLTTVLLSKYRKLSQKDLTVAKRAELQVVLEGIRYYHQAVISGEVIECTQKKTICHKLFEMTNRAIYALWDEIESDKNDIRLIYLPAYKEYLQSVCNAFRDEQIRNKLDAPSLIFTFALELLGNKAHMDSLFTRMHGIKKGLPQAFLCAVFVPTDEEVDDVFKYLPMLTHEVSHNFKYSETENRNEFIVKYMLNQISTHMIRRLFMQVADGKSNMFIGCAENMLSDALTNVLKTGLTTMQDIDYIKEGHLDDLPSLIYSILCAGLESDGEIEEYYPKKESKYAILQQSLLNLSAQSDLNWYIDTEKDAAGKSECEIIASLCMDILTSEEKDRIQRYNDFLTDNSRYEQKAHEMIAFYQQGKIKMDVELIITVAEEILISVIQKIKYDLKEYVEKNSLCEKILVKIVCKEKEFKSELDKLISLTGKSDEQIMIEFVDRCISARNCINSIYFLCQSSGQYIEKKDSQSSIFTQVYEALNNAVKQSLSDSQTRPYMASRDIHALMIKLGLLGAIDKPDAFIENYKSMLNAWGRQNIYTALEEYLMVYREIFADLSMCAVFRFNQLGYLSYLIEQFSCVREMGLGISANMTLERVQVVLRTIEHEYAKDKFVKDYREMKAFGVEWSEEWDDIVQSYTNGDRRDEYDERYLDVFENKIVGSHWVEALRGDETIKAIGQYYNSVEKTETDKKRFSKIFFDKYVKMAEGRKERYQSEKLEPISVMLEVSRNENA